MKRVATILLTVFFLGAIFAPEIIAMDEEDRAISRTIATEERNEAVSGDVVMEERNETYLYDYAELSDRGGKGILVSLTYVVPGREVGKKGIAGVELDIKIEVVKRFINKDKSRNVTGYLLAIITYPYIDEDNPDNNIPQMVLQYDIPLKEIHNLAKGQLI